MHAKKTDAKYNVLSNVEVDSDNEDRNKYGLSKKLYNWIDQ